MERQVFENLLICIKEEILEVSPLFLLKLCQLLFGKILIPKTLDFLIMLLIFNSKIRASGACLARRYPFHFTFFSLDSPSLLDQFKELLSLGHLEVSAFSKIGCLASRLEWNFSSILHIILIFKGHMLPE